ncbi:MAG: ATP-binding protein, partial [Myxococcota bacterium]|nr:ATP-binding protein [Myxococcota bacterium]
MSRRAAKGRAADPSRGATPYRGGAPADAKDAPEESGLVGELIRQFADPFAFYRELVQNSIDAGATQIHAQLVWEPGPDGEPGMLRVSVRDDGSGMPREVLEEDLTVLFRSTKEARDDAIGKFGIGFVSVLAVEPDVVIVDTSIGDGARWSLHLHADQTFDLYRADAPPERGTSVTLHIALAASEQPAFFERSEAALRRWCRHARIPIRFVALEPGRGEPVRDVRIDEPLSLDAPITVHARSRDGRTTVVAGLPRPGERYGAFYNQGLLLHETRDHELGEVAFKVMDARLEHTLSRDDVRRDEHHARAVELVARTIRGPLMEALAERMSHAAEVHARGGDGGAAQLLELIEAHSRSGLHIAPSGVKLPIVPLPGGARVATIDALGLASFEGRTPLATALARAGKVVLDLGLAPAETERQRVVTWLAQSMEIALPRDADVWSLIEPLEPTPSDEALLSSVAERLGQVLRRPSEIVIANVHGSARASLALPGSARRDPWLVPTSDLDADPFRLLARPPLVLRADHPIVTA